MHSRTESTSGQERAANSAHTAVELMRQLIRLASVNDGTPESGHEIDAVMVLKAFFDEVGAPMTVHILEPVPGRASIIARLHGSNPAAPSLGLVGHLDVVTVEERSWQHNPFGAEIIDGEVWGRGAVDMLYLTSSFATVFREVARTVRDGASLDGDLVFMGVADEEGGSKYGMRWLSHAHPDIIRVDAVLTEAGGMRVGDRVAVSVAEKGSAARRLHIQGRPGHASAPFGSENPITLLGEVVRRVSSSATETPVIHHLWREFVTARVDDAVLAERLTNPQSIDEALPKLGALAGYAHAVSRTTVTPTQVRAGVQHNTIPPTATIDLDIRTLPGVTDDEVDALLKARLADFSSTVRIERLFGWTSSASTVDSDLYETISEVMSEQLGLNPVPIMAAGGSDARFFRYNGAPAYGFGVLSKDWTYEKYRSLIHGHDERIDLESIDLTVRALTEVVTRQVGWQ